MSNPAFSVLDYHTPSDQWPTFSQWCDAQRHFGRHDRDNTEIDSWIVVPYIYTPNVSTLLDDSNHAAIEAILDEASPDGADYEMRYHGHWATDYEMLIVRPDSAAHVALVNAIDALSDYPVLDEEDHSDRECEAQYTYVNDEIQRMTFMRDGAELGSDAIADLASKVCSGLNSSELPSEEDILEQLAELGYTDDGEGNMLYDGACIPAGTQVQITAHKSPPQCGLEYPTTVATLLEECRPGGWDVVEVRMPNGKTKAVYSFSVSRIGE